MATFAGEVFLITGAASGIGREMTKQLLREGARVGGVDCHGDALAALEAELNHPKFASASADVTDRSAVLEAVRQLQQRLGPPDRLVACAGIGAATPGTNFSSADFEKVVRVNLIGVANAVEAVVPQMMERRRGHLVVLSSLASFRGLPWIGGYCASKAGVSALFESLRLDLKSHNIDVTTISPGWIRTPLTEPHLAQLPSVMPVEEAVRRILNAVRRRRPVLTFPSSYAAALQLLRFLPARLSDWFVLRFFS